MTQPCAADVMTEDVLTISPDTSLKVVAELMRDHRIGIIPVVDAQGHAVGVVTDRDIVVRADASAVPVTSARVADVMTRGLVAAHPDDDLLDVLDRMGDAGLHRMLVADHAGRLVGVISMSDLARRTDLPEKIQDTVDQISRKQRRG